MSDMTPQIVELISSLQKALAAQLEVNESLMKRLNALEDHAVATGQSVLNLIKEQHGGVQPCGKHCACKAGEM